MTKIRKNNNVKGSAKPITEEMILECLEKKKHKIKDIKEVTKLVAKIILMPEVYTELQNLGADFGRFSERFEKVFNEFLNRNL